MRCTSAQVQRATEPESKEGSTADPFASRCVVFQTPSAPSGKPVTSTSRLAYVTATTFSPPPDDGLDDFGLDDGAVAESLAKLARTLALSPAAEAAPAGDFAASGPFAAAPAPAPFSGSATSRRAFWTL